MLSQLLYHTYRIRSTIVFHEPIQMALLHDMINFLWISLSQILKGLIASFRKRMGLDSTMISISSSIGWDRIVVGRKPDVDFLSVITGPIDMSRKAKLGR